MKILFLDLEAIANPDNTPKSGVIEAFKSWRGFVPIGLTAPEDFSDLLNIPKAIASQFQVIKSIPKIKAIYVPSKDGSPAFEISNTGEAKRTPALCNFDWRSHQGVIEFYLSKYLTRPDGWLVSDRPKENAPCDRCGLTYISGVDWRGESSEDF